MRVIGAAPCRLCASLFLLASGACTYADDAILTTVDALVLERSEPAAGAVDVPRNKSVSLYFNVPIAGESVGDVSVRLFSGRIEANGSVSVDQLTQQVLFTPFDELRPGLRYRVRVSDTIRGLDGSRLPERIVFDFTTGTSSETLPPPPPQTTPVDDETIQQLWNASCTACHAGPFPALGLDLSSTAASRSSLIGVRSVEVSLLRVAPGKHAESFLLRKLTETFNFAGMPMPPSGELLDQQRLRTVANWIDSLEK